MVRPSRARPLGQAFGERADAGDRHDAERDAGDEDEKPAHAGAQLAQRKFKREQGRAAGRQRRSCARLHAARLSMRPERSRTMRSQRCASAASCVTSTSVVPRSRVACEQQIDDLLAGGFVEIAGRLVGHQDRRIGRMRACERHALLLAAGELRRIMDSRSARPTAVKLAPRALVRVGMPASSSGTATFSSAVMVGMRWKDWNTMPTLRPRKRASASSSNVPRSCPPTAIVPASAAPARPSP